MDPDRPIKEIMTTDLVTVAPEARASEIKAMFEKHSFHHLPVVNPGEGLVGIISKEDFFKVSYMMSLNTTGRTWSEMEYGALTARHFMTQYPLVLDPEDSIGLAADIFLANKFHALPIVEDEKLVGLITSHDLLNYGYNSSYIEKEEEEPEEETL